MGRKEDEAKAAAAKAEEQKRIKEEAERKEALAAEQQAKVDEATNAMMEVYNARFKKTFADLEKEINMETIDVSWYNLSKKQMDDIVYRIDDMEAVQKFHAHDCNLNLDKMQQFIEMFERGTIYIRELWLNNNELGDETMGLLADAIKTNSYLKNLYLANNKLTCDGCTSLGEMFKTNHDLERLSLSQNPLTEGGGDGFQVLFESLEDNESCGLTHLYLSNCRLGDAQIKLLTTWIATRIPKLCHLELYHNNFTDASASPLLKLVEERRAEGNLFICLLHQGNDGVSKEIKDKFGDRNGEFWPEESDSEEDDDDIAYMAKARKALAAAGGGNGGDTGLGSNTESDSSLHTSRSLQITTQ